jgi:hypothetical protein
MVPVYVTPGGHRRFALTDIETLREQKPLGSTALANTWAQRALDQTRTELQRVDNTSDNAPVWLTRLEEKEREAWRQVSMRLMGVVLRYVSAQDNDDMLLEEARTIGHDYAVNALRCHMPLSTALEAALFFRDSLADAAMNMPEHTNLHHESSARLLRRISSVLNVVQLAVVSNYELYYRENED